MRTQNSIRILKANLTGQVIHLVLGFVNRSIFLAYLGSEYLGLSSLFVSLIGTLSLLDLGLSGAIAYSLYKPLNANDFDRINQIVAYYKTFYRRIAVLMFIIGISILPFLRFVISDLDSLPFSTSYIQTIFLFFLTETVVTYFFAHRYTLIIVGQKSYRIVYTNIVSEICLQLVRWMILQFTGNFMLYVSAGILSKLLTGLYVSRSIHSLFPEYRDHKKSNLAKEDIKAIKDSAKRLSMHSIASYVVNSTDNLIISTFVGLSKLGFYMNYYLIFSTIRKLLSSMVESFQAPLGDLVAEGNKERVFEVLKLTTHGVYLLGSFSSISLLFLSTPFVSLWLGSQFRIDEAIVWVSSISVFVWMITRPIWKLSAVTGLFREDVINAVAEAGINAVVSLILVVRYGIVGTLAGTIVSYAVAFLLKSRLQFTKYFHRSQGAYFKQLSIYLVTYVFNIAVVIFIFSNIRIENSVLDFLFKVLVCAIVPNGLNLILFYRTEHNRVFLNRVILGFFKKR